MLAIAFASTPTAVQADPSLVAIGGVNAAVEACVRPISILATRHDPASKPRPMSGIACTRPSRSVFTSRWDVPSVRCLRFGRVSEQGVSYQPIQFAIGSQIALADRGWLRPTSESKTASSGLGLSRLLFGVSVGVDLGRCQNRRWAC